MAYDGPIHARCRNRSVSDNRTTGFWEEKDKENEEDAGEDSQKPKNGLPPQVLGKKTADGRTEGRTEKDSGGGITHVFPSLCGSSYVGHDSHRESDGSATAKSLHDAKKKQCEIASLQRQPDIRQDKDDEANDEGQSASAAVRHAANDCRSNCLCTLLGLAGWVGGDSCFAWARTM